VPTTALIAAGVGAAGSIGSSLIGANASKTASNQQVQMQQQALQQQKDMFGVAQGALNPFITSGQSVLGTLQKLITPGADQTATLSQTPGFQFASQYGTKAATNALAAKGQGMSSGPLATAVSQFNNGLAQNTWQNTVNALQGYASLGANSAGNLAGGAISSGNAMAGTIGNIGNAQASGTLGSANALAGGLTGAAGAGSNALLFSKLFSNNSGGGGGGLYDGTSYGPMSLNGAPLGQ
jgi:hypothetical protein